jgi:hypothetical protein
MKATKSRKRLIYSLMYFEFVAEGGTDTYLLAIYHKYAFHCQEKGSYEIYVTNMGQIHK